jgi:hypothetical protein
MFEAYQQVDNKVFLLGLFKIGVFEEGLYH